MTSPGIPSATDRLWAVVPAGGAGTRLWPMSRAATPKFLLDLTGSGRTLIQATADRLTPLVGDRIVVVTGAVHERAVRSQLPGLDQLVAEPSPRDSMAAIGLAAARLELEDPAALIGSFAADHVITDESAFAACVREAAEVAASGLLVTIGIEPTHAATGFGYVRAGAALAGFPTARMVTEFVEKPDAERAEAYVRGGEHRWNAGMFLVGATMLLDLLAENHPALADGLRAIAADPTLLGERWPGLTRIAIDHAVAEPAAAAGRVAMVPGPFGWEDHIVALDVLTYAGTLTNLDPVIDSITFVRGDIGDADLVLSRDASGLVVPAAGRTVAVVGIEDVVVVDTGDALLVTTSAHAQDVKGIVDQLRQSGRTDLV